jgi:antitoxin (DNA-binding transcriptional repressor) of toxin-antitoxin stability system
VRWPSGRRRRFAKRKSASRPTSVFLVNRSLFSTSPIERVGYRWLWKRGFCASQGQSWGQPTLRNQIESDNLIVVKTLSVTDVARNFSAVLDDLERDQEEVVLVRNQRPIARLVPEAPRQDALSVFGDLYRTLDDKTAEALSAAIASGRKGRRGHVSELRDPWAG